MKDTMIVKIKRFFDDEKDTCICCKDEPWYNGYHRYSDILVNTETGNEISRYEMGNWLAEFVDDGEPGEYRITIEKVKVTE